MQQEQARIRLQKEKEWAKLRAAQQRVVDSRGEKDLMRAQAEQERLDKQQKEQEMCVSSLALLPSRPLALSPSRPLALSPSRPLALSPSRPLTLSPSRSPFA
jgi:hypothetical protein